MLIAALRRPVLIIAAALLLAACGKSSNTGGPPPPEVTAAKVLNKRVMDWDEYTGRMQAVDTVEVRPRVSGYIDKVLFAEGKLVKQGDVLVLIDPRPYQADYNRAKAGVALAKSQYELAKVEVERVQKLKGSGAVSREELDERLSALHQAQANIESAQASLDAVALNLSFTQVTSPISGRTGRAEVTRGNLVTGGLNGGTLLTTVVSIDPIHVYFEADESAYLRYSAMARSGERPSSRDVDNPVQLGLSNEEGYPHLGHMNFVDNQVNPQTGTMRGRAVFDNKDGLFAPGLFVRLRLLGSGEYEAILIEDQAVGTDQNQKFVFVLGPDNKVEYRKVKLGRIIDGLRVVRDGLKPGDVVVVNGLQRVHPGAQVAPKLVMMGESGTAAETAPAGTAKNTAKPGERTPGTPKPEAKSAAARAD